MVLHVNETYLSVVDCLINRPGRPRYLPRPQYCMPQYAAATEVPRVSSFNPQVVVLTSEIHGAHDRRAASESAERGRAHFADVSPGSVPATASGRVAQSRARVLRLRRVGGDPSPLRPLLPLGDPPGRVDRVARGQLVSQSVRASPQSSCPSPFLSWRAVRCWSQPSLVLII